MVESFKVEVSGREVFAQAFPTSHDPDNAETEASQLPNQS